MPNEKQYDFPTEAAKALRSFAEQDLADLEIVEVTWEEIRPEINIDQRTEFCYWDSLAFFGIRKKRGKNKWLRLVNITRGGDAGNRAIILHCQETERRPRSDGPETTYVEMFKYDSYKLISAEEVAAFVKSVQRILQGG